LTPLLFERFGETPLRRLLAAQDEGATSAVMKPREAF
jgi:hypothetical protein